MGKECPTNSGYIYRLKFLKNMDGKRISIIIPMYNAQKYIERCIRSLMQQTLKNDIEYIVVDDCSSDDSLYILRNVLNCYPERLNHVHVIENKRNLGIYRTRCIGAEAAKGDYIGWVDSDDWVDAKMFEKMLEATNNGNIDIVVCDYVEYRLGRTTQIQFKSSGTPIECIERYRLGMFFSGTLWNQIFRRDLLVNHMHDIIPTNYSEDTYIIWHIYAHAHSIAYVNSSLYHYDKRNQKSLMHTRAVSKNAWKEQEKNLENIETKLYSSSKEYQRSLYYLMFWRKYEYKSAFETPALFYKTFRRASWSILYFPGMTIFNKLKIFIMNNCYPLFWIYNKRMFHAVSNN